MSYANAAGDDTVQSQALSQGFQNQYGEPNSNLQNITRDTSGGANAGHTDNIPIDNTIQHYELPNLTQRKFTNRYRSIANYLLFQCSMTIPTKKKISFKGASELVITMLSGSCPITWVKIKSSNTPERNKRTISTS